MTCERCDGNRQVYVSEEFVERTVTRRPDEADAALLRRRADARESVYPCPICNRAAFLMWDAGHYAPGHRRSSCAECREHFGLDQKRGGS